MGQSHANLGQTPIGVATDLDDDYKGAWHGMVCHAMPYWYTLLYMYVQ
jgi:hypothetical protein